MSLEVKRNYLEIYSIDDLIDVKIIQKKFSYSAVGKICDDNVRAWK